MPRTSKASTKTTAKAASSSVETVSLAVPCSESSQAEPELLFSPEVEAALDAMVEDLAPQVFQVELRRRLRLKLSVLVRDSGWVEAQVAPYKPLIGAAVAANALAGATS